MMMLMLPLMLPAAFQHYAYDIDADDAFIDGFRLMTRCFRGARLILILIRHAFDLLMLTDDDDAAIFSLMMPPYAPRDRCRCHAMPISPIRR